jgi:hypothetical protein
MWGPLQTFVVTSLKYEKCIGIIHWGDPGVDGRIILEWIFRKLDVEGMEWIGLAQDRDR